MTFGAVSRPNKPPHCRNLKSVIYDKFILTVDYNRGNILKRKNLKDFKPKLTVDRNNYMSAFRKNVFQYVDDKEITLNQISEEADIPYSTLKTFLYGDSKDCNLSTAVKLARAFGISVDRLIGAETIKADTVDMWLAYESLPKSSQALVGFHINNQIYLHKQHNDKKEITIMKPDCNGHGNLKKTEDYELLDISSFGSDIMHKVYFGIKMPCAHFLPHYKEDDILLIANDRDAIGNEKTVVLIHDNLIITKRVVENGVVKYYGLRDNAFRTEEKDYIQVIGYIVKVIEGQ